MKFAIITHVDHVIDKGQYFAYGPYVREMNLWLRYVDEVIIVAPLTKKELSKIDLAYKHQHIEFLRVPLFDVTSLNHLAKTFLKLPILLFSIYKAMQQADHIHLRCPGNMGLLGCLVQIAFPKKPKTAKYAGNWDPKSKQPWSYKLQQAILRNTFLTKNMKVLAYGDWPQETKNILPFFTATYFEKEKEAVVKRDYTTRLQFLFIGTLSPGKQPLYVLALVKEFIQHKVDVVLDIYGDGSERKAMEKYIKEHQLEKYIHLHGNQPKEIVKEQLQKAHFLVLPSKSEGWPKVVAEAMFWGCIPMVTPISCVPWMLANGERGFLLTQAAEKEVLLLLENLDTTKLATMAEKAVLWSRHYTLDYFETEIQKLLKS